MDDATRREALKLAAVAGVAVLGASLAPAAKGAQGRAEDTGKESGVTFEAIDASMQKVDLAAYQKGGKMYFTPEQAKTSPGEVIPKFCSLYHKFRPFLLWAEQSLLVPKKWKAVIKMFRELLDKICPDM